MRLCECVCMNVQSLFLDELRSYALEYFSSLSEAKFSAIRLSLESRAWYQMDTDMEQQQTHKADKPANPPSLPWLICLAQLDPTPALIGLLHTLCNHGNCLTLLVVGQSCATGCFLQGSRPTFAPSCRNKVSGDGGNNVCSEPNIQHS